MQAKVVGRLLSGRSTPGSATTGSISSTDPTSSSPPGINSVPASADDNHTGGSISTGAEVGIALAVSLAVFITLLTIYLYWRRIRSKQFQERPYRSPLDRGVPELETKETASELWGSKYHPNTDRELLGEEIHEAPNRNSQIALKVADDPETLGPPVRPNGLRWSLQRGIASARSGLGMNQMNADDREEVWPLQDTKPPISDTHSGPVPTHLPMYQPPTYEDTTPLVHGHSQIEPPATAAVAAVPSEARHSMQTEDTPHPTYIVSPASHSAPELPLRVARSPPAPPYTGAATPATPMTPSSPNNTVSEEEVARLRAELDQVRRERDRLQLMHSLNAREEELKRAIEVREMG